MKLYLKISVLLFVFLSSNRSKAQETIGATILTSSGNQHRVQIKPSARDITPQYFTAVGSEKDAFSILKPDSIKFVQLDSGETYEAYNVSLKIIGREYVERLKVDYTKSQFDFSGPVFLERLISGKTSLYRLKDKFGFNHFFFRKEGEDLVYLPNQSYKDANGKLFIDPSFRNLIDFQFFSTTCHEATKATVLRLEYALKPMLSIFQKLNECQGDSVAAIPAISRHRPKLRVALIGGATVYGQFTETAGKPYSTSINPTAGLSFQLLPGKTVKDYSINIDITYHYSSIARGDAGPGGAAGQTLTYYMLNVSPTVDYYFKKKPTAFYLVAGPNFSYLLNGSNIEKNIILQGTSKYVEEKGGTTLVGLTVGGGYAFSGYSIQGVFSTWPTAKANGYWYTGLSSYWYF